MPSGGLDVESMAKGPDFLERIGDGVVLCDGAMGTYLHRKGVPMDRCFPEQNLTEPERVEAIHREYIAAGAELVRTNSYGANRLQLERYGLADDVRRINIHACRLARQASENRSWVAGSVGPLGRPLEPLGSLSRELATEVFREQVEALAEGGADLIMIETISDLEEFEVALAAARAACDLPVVIHKTFTEDGRTLMGELPHDVVGRAQAGGADVVGANCTVGPQRMLDIIERMVQRADLPLSALPTAGLPRLVGERIDYHAEPEYMGRYSRLLAEAGAAMVGACCGSTPEHIAAMRAALDEAPIKVRKRDSAARSEDVEAREPVPLRERTQLAASLGRSFVVAVELELPRGHDLEPTLRQATALKEAGADTLVLADALRPRLFVHPLVVAYRLQKEVGVECVQAYATRDKNVLGIQSDLLAAHVFGVRNLLVSTGDPANFGDYPTAATLTDLSTSGLVKILDSMNRGLDLAGNTIGEPTAFVSIVNVSPTARDMEAELRRAAELVEAGAVALLTKPLFAADRAEALLEPLGSLGVPLIVGVLPLRSLAHAEYLHNEVPGLDVPESVRARLEKAARPEEEGLGMARELVQVLPDVAAGVHVVPPYRKQERVLQVLEQLRVDSVHGVALAAVE